MIKVCVIGVYFGCFPNYFPLWLKSCEANSSVDFIIVTDNKLEGLPSNVSSIQMTLPEFKALADRKLGLDTALNSPYKCCDFKPVYGKILDEFIFQYDYWGHCDFDLLFGDLRYFFDKYNIEKYDKFLPLGHLAFYRNTEECNNRFMIEPKSGNSYKESFTVPNTTQFDELAGINAIYQENGFSFFRDRVFVDVSRKWERIKCAEDYKDPYDSKNNSKDINYFYQVFAWNKGKIIRYYFDGDRLCDEEYMYIHVKKRKFDTINEELLRTNLFYITPHAFVNADKNKQISKELIQKLNPNPGTLYEKLESMLLKRLKARIRKCIKVK